MLNHLLWDNEHKMRIYSFKFHSLDCLSNYASYLCANQVVSDALYKNMRQFQLPSFTFKKGES